MKNTITNAAAIFLLAACFMHPALAQTRIPKSDWVELTPQNNMGEAFAKAFQPTGAFAPTFKRPEFKQRQLAIGSFQVEYVTEQEVKDATREPDVFNYFLRNASEAQMQEATNKAYAAFVELVKARGYEVVAAEKMAATPFKDQLALGAKGPLKREKAGAAAQAVSGTNLGGLAALASGGVEKKAEGDSDWVTTFAANTAPFPVQKVLSTGELGQLSKDLNAIVVAVKLRLNFLRFEEGSGLRAKVVLGKPQNVIAAEGAQINFYGPAAGEYWPMFVARRLTMPNAVAEKAVRMEVKAEEKSKAVASSALSLVTGFFGKGGLSAQRLAEIAGESPNHEVTASGDYVDKTSSDLRLALQMMAEAFPK